MVAQLLSGSGLGHMDYDTKILPRTGGYGRYNRLVVVCSWFPTFAVSLNLISDVFYTRIPDSYHCRADPQLLPSAFLLSNLSSQRYLNLTVPRVDGAGLSRCQLFKYPSNWSELSENAPREKVPCTRGWEFAHDAGLQSTFVTEVGAVARGGEGGHLERFALALPPPSVSNMEVEERVQSQLISAGIAVTRTLFHSCGSMFAQAAGPGCGPGSGPGSASPAACPASRSGV